MSASVVIYLIQSAAQFSDSTLRHLSILSAARDLRTGSRLRMDHAESPAATCRAQ